MSRKVWSVEVRDVMRGVVLKEWQTSVLKLLTGMNQIRQSDLRQRWKNKIQIINAGCSTARLDSMLTLRRFRESGKEHSNSWMPCWRPKAAEEAAFRPCSFVDSACLRDTAVA